MAEQGDAVVIVHWPGREVPACARHLQALQALATVMGFDLSSSVIIVGAMKCTNCENEADNIDPEKILPSTY